MTKQTSLKPQDLLVALKIATMESRAFTFAELASQLHMSASEVHAATKRAQVSRFLIRQSEGLSPVKSSLLEFLLHGVRYAFPATQGTLVRGMPTGISGPALKKHFANTDDIPYVWPDPEGDIRGISFLPIYPTVPQACRDDPKLYEVLTLVDALRGGAARDRELAKDELMERLK